ncbi:MAG TPA: glycosyltransferase [Rhodanobacteraceae bacterium]|nr:glycosyltransferase [Rhodanobacteraceae bacterium]
MPDRLNIAMFGSSLVSSYWNGAATYYRGVLRALAARGHRIRFYEPDALDRQKHRDIADPPWAIVHVYQPGEAGALEALRHARCGSDIVIKASGVGVDDELLEREVAGMKPSACASVFWDVDAPATLERMEANPSDPFRELVPRFDMVLTYGGGPRVVSGYRAFGARDCVPIYNALDPDTHHPEPPRGRYAVDLAFLGNRLPDRESRVHEFFFKPATQLPECSFLLGGAGWDSAPPNVRLLGHVPTAEHNALNCSARLVLNINRDSMARYGWSPPTRVFEAGGAGACLVVDRWDGIEMFLEPGREVLVAESGDGVAEYVRTIGESQARAIGRRARQRLLKQHTYALRAAQVESVLLGRELEAA